MNRLAKRYLPYSLLRMLPAVCLLASFPGSMPAQTVEELRLTVGKSIVLDYPSDVRQISTSDPTIVDAMAVTTREILLHAKGPGFATVIIWSKTGQRTIYSIGVDQNLESVRRLLKETFPNEAIQLQSSRESLSLTGKVSSKEIGDRAAALVQPFGRTIVNNLVIAPLGVEKQVMLRVKFAELDRSAAELFGVNIVSTGAGNTIGRLTTGQFQAPSVGELSGSLPSPGSFATSRFNISDALNIFAFRPDLNLAAFIQALRRENVLQILTEPNLVTTNGKEASFLVGGEFPVPILQGGGNAGAVTVQFREFGIRLTFNPLVTENGTIKLYVKPEVSSIDLSRAVTLSGFLIPALSTRRMETNIELGVGQSFVIAGLLDDQVTANLQKIPGLGNVPLLGYLFKSREERKSKTELIVMVTPEIVKPLLPGDPKPELDMPREFLPSLVPESKSKGDTTPSAAPPSATPSKPASSKGTSRFKIFSRDGSSKPAKG